MKYSMPLLQRSRIALLIAVVLFGLALLSGCNDSSVTLVPATAAVSTTATVPATAAVSTTATIPTTAARTITIPAITPVPSPAPVTAPPLGSAEGILKATGFSGEDAHALLNELTQQIGTRVVGSPNEQKTADWLEKNYKAFGYTQVERQEFPVTQGEIRNGVIFTGSEPTQENVKGFGFLFSKPKSIELKATLAVYAVGADLKGKIVVLVSSDSLEQLKPKVEATVKAGGVAVIIASPTGPLNLKIFEANEIPVIGVATDQLQELQRIAGQAVTLVATYQAAGMSLGHNVITTRPGPKPTAPVLIFGGHYDSVANTVAASDNGSGTVITLELAKVLFKKFPEYELRFINFSGEEIGMVGSNYYASKLTAEEKKRITAFINVDSVGVGDRFVAIGNPELVKLSVGVANQNGIKLEAFDLSGTGASSDHEAFTKNGIKAVMLGRWIDPQLHRPGDTPDRVYPEALLLGGGTAILTVERLIGD
ncbi:MAG: M28 family peptidase [Chloroflexi bacterium]|nr:M28 family peptidase [Chloroflexota bacterium]